MITFSLLVLGLLGLWLGSELTVKGAVGMARRLGLSNAFIGMTVVSLCTNLPELMISITGAFQQAAGAEVSGLVIGNVVGSNMSQATLILGLAGLLAIIRVKKQEIIKIGLMLVLSSLLLLVLAQDGFISRTDGLLLLFSYIFFLFTIKPKSHRSQIRAKFLKLFSKKSWENMVKLVLGIVITLGASVLVVNSAVDFAQMLGVNQLLVGLFLVGVGTSLPELAVSLLAVRKKAAGISVGNIVGSNIIGALLALGSSALVGGWQVDYKVARFDLPFMLLVSVVLVLFLLTKKRLDRKESILLILLYGVYASLKLLHF